MACANYTADLTGGQTFARSNAWDVYGFTVGRLFDGLIVNASEHWAIQNPLATEWFQVQFSSAKAIAKIRICGPNDYGWGVIYAIDQFVVKASNAGAFAGEEVTLFTSASGLAWTSNEWKQGEWDNDASYLYYRVYCARKSALYLALAECEMMECLQSIGEVEDAAGIGDAADGFSLSAVLSDSAGLGDSIAAYSSTGYFADSAGMGDSIDAADFAGTLVDLCGISDSVDAGWEVAVEIPDAAGLGDAVSGGYELSSDGEDQAGFGDSADAFNWTEWLAANRDQAVARFYLTLTGEADLLDDIEIPISSFQARKNTGTPTYVSAVVPGVAFADAIAERSNGEIVIEMAFEIRGIESLREEILRADLETIGIQEGPRSRSITLSGHRTKDYASKNARLYDPIYRARSNGKRTYRFAVPDIYVNSGDTGQVDSDEFTIGSIVYMVSAGGGQTVMEVQE